MSNQIQGMMPTTLNIAPGDGTNNEFLTALYQFINTMAVQVNAREIGYYDVTNINVNGQQYFPNRERPESFRAGMRKFIYYPMALPNAAGTIAIPHTISVTSTTTFTRIYGVTNNTGGYSALPLPFASPTAAQNISLEVNATDVLLTVGADRSAYTQTYLVLDFIID